MHRFKQELIDSGGDVAIALKEIYGEDFKVIDPYFEMKKWVAEKVVDDIFRTSDSETLELFVYALAERVLNEKI